MILVEALDSKYISYKKKTVKTARWLMKRFNKGDFYLDISLVNSKTMPKNVLSFPADADFPHPNTKQKPLGEIYLNPDVIKEQGWQFEYILIHGFLHLLGYDHIKKSDRIVMERLEEKLLSELNG
jgi:rRNA maturation RNase YbeY